MTIFRGCSNLVIRCFKRVEHFADWITGAAGPVFVFLCWTLIIFGGVAFFDVIGRDLSSISTFLLSPILILVPLNLYGQYWLVTHVPPGYPSPRALALSPDKPLDTSREVKWILRPASSVWKAERWGLGPARRSLSGGQPLTPVTPGTPSGEGSIEKRVRRCRKCDGPKPERTHHCSVCKRCILLMDHHCPWINGCVGLHNQRHFVLFMAWLSIACWTVSVLGYGKFWVSFDYRGPWPSYTPRIGFTLLYVLAIAIGIAVPILMGWHLYMVSKGETTIESHDNAYLENKASAEGLIYLNPYDLGRRHNLETFFNIQPGGYPWLTLFFPFLVPPVSNGWQYPRRPLPAAAHAEIELHSPELAAGLVGRSAELGEVRGGYVMGDKEGLTDDEDGGGGWMD